MALQLYADGVLVFDSRLEDHALIGLKTTTALNKGGTAEIIMPPGHPSYNAFICYRTIVELYENGARKFRGRALYPTTDFYNKRTITCEGERCFFRDGVIRPYLYQDTPAVIFADALAKYNASVDEFKRFTLGTVTVTDANDYVRLESESAETFADFFDKLQERCGGYIVFHDAEDGSRAVSWLTEIGTTSTQAIEFGSNLLDFTDSGQSPDLATAIVPYGARLEDGTRVTIESVTDDGTDVIIDEEAVAFRGIITATATWDDVTEPANLLARAREWLNEHKLAISSIKLTAADLSRIDRSINGYNDGDLVTFVSPPHGINDTLRLTERTTDWLDPGGGNITLGKTITSLTGADALFEQESSRSITKAASEAVTTSSAEINKVATKLEKQIYEQARKAFADDTSSVRIASGVVTFSNGTLAIESDYFKLSSGGIVAASNADISGVMTTEDGIYKAQLIDGGVNLYLSGVLCGKIGAKQLSDEGSEGVSLRIEDGGDFIVFEHYDDSTRGYIADYYLNYGWSSDYEEKHIFLTSARFLDDVYLEGSLVLRGANGKWYRITAEDGGLKCTEI